MLYELCDIRRIYGDRTVLDIPRLGVEAGCVYTLLGPNGAGKSTLLKLLAFLDAPTAGELRFQGELVGAAERSYRDLRRRVVLIDQTPIMFSGSVYGNVEFGLRVRGVARGRREAMVMDALAQVGMEGFAQADARGLSGGETKRVALARGLVLRPDVLLCDEPTANVDLENQEIILSILTRINRQSATSVIFSTHYLAEGQRLADRTLLLQNGRLAETVCENVFRAPCERSSSGALRVRLNGNLHLQLPLTVAVPVNVARLQIDPAVIRVNPVTREDEWDNQFVGRLVAATLEESAVRLVVDAGIRLTVRMPEAQFRTHSLTLGEEVRLAISGKAVSCTTM